MGCFASGVAAFVPRFVLVAWWIFGDKVGDAFGSWIWPLLGIVFAPWTTLAIVLAWQPGGLSGNWDVFLVVVGVALDVLTYMHRLAAKSVQKQYRSRY